MVLGDTSAMPEGALERGQSIKSRNPSQELTHAGYVPFRELSGASVMHLAGNESYDLSPWP